MKRKNPYITLLMLTTLTLINTAETDHINVSHIKDILLKSKSLPKQYKNYCLNKHPQADKLSTKEKLREFAKGPCSPLIVLPGVMASKLRVQINCKKFRKHFPYTFRKCGWTSCKVTKNIFKIF